MADDLYYRRAVDILRKGGLVALPTETVYGLAADARNDKAVSRLYRLKGRPAHNPLIAHVFAPEHAHDLAQVSPLAQALIDAFWPGPLTLVLPRLQSGSLDAGGSDVEPRIKLSDKAGGWLPTIALRCPDAPWRPALLQGGWSAPIFMPSANISGHVSPTTAQHVADDFGDAVELIIDGGPCESGIESTVAQVKDGHIVLLRLGAVSAQDLAPFCDDIRSAEDGGASNTQPSAPGMLGSHYAPNAPVRLNAKTARPNEIFLGFGPQGGDLQDGAHNLSTIGNLQEAAYNLYSALRRLDKAVAAAPDKNAIAIAPIPETGLGAAINDRLSRAAVPPNKSCAP